MGRLICLWVAVAIFSACDKRTETAVKMSGLWTISSTNIQMYEDNEVVKDSTVDQQGSLSLITTDGLENKAATNLAYAPCWPQCRWEIPQKKYNQIFFSLYSETSPYIQASSVMIEKYSSKKLVLVKILYDGDLNLVQKSTWEFSKAKL